MNADKTLESKKAAVKDAISLAMGQIKTNLKAGQRPAFVREAGPIVFG